MTYGEFKKRCQETDTGKLIFILWIEAKIPLVPAMELLKKYNPNGNKKKENQ